jgi:predicted PurR-regulated permease PerM
VSNDATSGGPGSTDPRPTPDQEGSSERLTERLAHQWAALRERRSEPMTVTVGGGTSNFSRAQVPWALDLAAAWSWRLIVIGLATFALFKGLVHFAELTIPVVVALLITALGAPIVGAMERVGIRRKLGAGIVVLGLLLLVVGMLGLAGNQIANGANDLATQVSSGLGDLKDWLTTGPLNLTDKQISDYIQKAQDNLTQRAEKGEVLSQATNFGTALGHVLAGLFLVLFSTYFFLADGERIWSWAGSPGSR